MQWKLRWKNRNHTAKMCRISLGKQFCYFWNNREEVILKINQETKHALHWPNCKALQWLLPVLWLDPGGCDMDLYFFFCPTDRLQLFQTRKKSLWLDIFFNFKFPTDQLDKIGSSSIPLIHSRNQPTVALDLVNQRYLIETNVQYLINPNFWNSPSAIYFLPDI